MEGQDIFWLFEGVNPNNQNNPVKIVSMGGTPEFLADMAVPEGITPTVWTDEGCVGGLEFEDEVTHEKFYIERRPNGDWV